MIKRILFSNKPYDLGLAIVRFFAGIIIIPFGMEMFNAETMSGYEQWLTDKGVPLPLLMAYLGKVAELAGGVLLILGLFTRAAGFFLMCPMAVVTFIMLEGKITDMTFLLLLLFAVFAFVGGGKYSLDEWIRRKMSPENE